VLWDRLLLADEPVTSLTRPKSSASGKSLARSFARRMSFRVRRAMPELLVAKA
jgi:hypothetical protein